jgi:hypothetical protein
MFNIYKKVMSMQHGFLFERSKAAPAGPGFHYPAPAEVQEADAVSAVQLD